jgi:5'-nucleotidase (lipoprotein e(P4) family)
MADWRLTSNLSDNLRPKGVILMHRSLIVASMALVCIASVGAQAPPIVHELGIKYVRDSEEYAALARQVYRLAGDAVQRSGQAASNRRWAVVMDIDETALDNSTYQLDRASYGLPFDDASWNAWVLRRAAAAVPGVVPFIAKVRQAGGHVAWISDRDTTTFDATQVNLTTTGLWNSDDRLCLKDPKDTQRNKAARRAEVIGGKGACAWDGAPTTVTAFLGDQMSDFPQKGESFPAIGDDAFGRTWFLLPNPMYGRWTTQVTRMLQP